MRDTGIVSEQHATHHMWAEYTKHLDIPSGTRTDRSWFAPASVKNRFQTPADVMSFFLPPSTKNKQARANSALYQNEFKGVLSGAYTLIENSLVIGELWEASDQGSQPNLLSVENEHELSSRLADRCDMLRRLAFLCFARYTLYPQFLVNDLGNLNFPFLRHSMFQNLSSKLKVIRRMIITKLTGLSATSTILRNNGGCSLTSSFTLRYGPTLLPT